MLCNLEPAILSYLPESFMYGFHNECLPNLLLPSLLNPVDGNGLYSFVGSPQWLFTSLSM